MNRRLAVLVSVAMLVAAVGPAVAVAQPGAAQAADDGPLAAEETTTASNATDEAANQTTPGAMLSGTIGVQKAEMNGEIERRAFGIQVAQAASNQSAAQVLARTQERLQDRVGELEQRRDRLQASRENGSISESRYRAQIAVMAAESAQVQTMANVSTQTAQGLPADVLQANGVNVTAIQQLRERARAMSGPEVAAIARQIAGPNVGAPMGPPDDVPGSPAKGPQTESGDGPGNGTNGGPPTATPTNETTQSTDGTTSQQSNGPGA
jgi:hypothetical protein